MELLISENVARNLYRDVNDVVLKAFTVLIRGNILRKTEYTINPQMTRTELVPPNKTKSTTRRRSEVVTSKTVFAWPLAQITFKKITYYLSRITSNTYFQIKFSSCWNRKQKLHKLGWHLRKSNACRLRYRRSCFQLMLWMNEQKTINRQIVSWKFLFENP